MLGLRYFVCGRCDTAFAEPASVAPGDCGACGADAVEEITDRLRDPTYFLASEE